MYKLTLYVLLFEQQVIIYLLVIILIFETDYSRTIKGVESTYHIIIISTVNVQYG